MRLGQKASLALVFLILMISCQRQGKQEKSTVSGQGQISSDVPVLTINLQPWPTIVRVQGSLAADEVTSVAARVAGRVVEVHYDLGDTVEANDTLVRLDSREFELKLAQAEAQLAQARAAIGLQPDDLLESLNPANAPPVREARAVLEEAKQQTQRLEPLFKQGAIVANDWETAQSLMSVAEARYNSAMNGVREKIALVRVQSALMELARQELDDTTIPAPFRGLIQSRLVAQGKYVQVGEPLMEIAKTDRLRYRASVPERYAQSLSVGQKVHIVVGGQERSGRVSRIAPTLDPLNRSLTFEAMVDNSDGSLRGGLFAPAELVLDDQSQAVVVQPASLIRFAGVDKVWRFANGQVQEVVVRLGRETDQGIEVVEGLAPGDQILQFARDGSRGSFSSEEVQASALAAQSRAKSTHADDAPAAVKSISTTPEGSPESAEPTASQIADPRT